MMTHKNAKAVILLYLISIVALSFVLAVVIIEHNRFFLPISIALLLTGVVIALIRYLEKSTNELTHFLLSIREGIFMDASAGGRQPIPQNKFNNTLNEITREFAKVSLEKELQFQYLKTLNENIGAGILAVNENGSIRMINPAAKRMLNISDLARLSDLQRVHTNLYSMLLRMKPEESELVKLPRDGEEMQISIQMKDIVLQKEKVSIFLFQNINRELDQKEIEAWQQLTRVLTHEIMNSVTPITSLARAAQSILHNRNAPKTTAEISNENLEDIHHSIDTIASRSQNLLKFVTTYKAFTKSISLNLQEADLVVVIERIVALLSPEAERDNIKMDFRTSQRMVLLRVDVALVEQVIINLIRNSLDALKGADYGTIDLYLESDQKMVRLSIADTGKGMDSEVISKIFIPFYTTKPGGSGIGLSLSRQIMLAHKGAIRLHSAKGKGTTFFLEWKR